MQNTFFLLIDQITLNEIHREINYILAHSFEYSSRKNLYKSPQKRFGYSLQCSVMFCKIVLHLLKMLTNSKSRDRKFTMFALSKDLWLWVFTYTAGKNNEIYYRV